MLAQLRTIDMKCVGIENFKNWTKIEKMCLLWLSHFKEKLIYYSLQYGTCIMYAKGIATGLINSVKQSCSHYGMRASSEL